MMTALSCSRLQAGTRRVVAGLYLLPAFLALSACDLVSGIFSKEEERLPGTRLLVLETGETLGTTTNATSAQPVALPPPRINLSWSQAGGSADHNMGHPAASDVLSLQWDTNIGEGTNADQLLLARPVIAEGRVYVVDVDSQVSAFDIESRDRLWSFEIAGESDEDLTFGGGIAYDAGRLFVTTGFAHTVAVGADTGEELWRAVLPAPIRAAPTVSEGRVFIITVDNQMFVLDSETGERLWSHVGASEIDGFVGGASPAVAEDVVIVPYSSGEVYALRVTTGREIWRDSLGALNALDALSSIADITGLPIVDGERVFIVSHAGRSVALDLRKGTRIWERAIGSTQTPWLAGDYLYILSNSGQLFCLRADDGTTVWTTPLRPYENMKEREDPIVWHGPVLAGDRLIVVGSHGTAVSVSPYTGLVLGQVAFPHGLNIAPTVAAESLFLLDDDANLYVLR